MLPSSTCGITGFVTSVGNATGTASDNVIDGVGLGDTILMIISGVHLACICDAIEVISETCNHG